MRILKIIALIVLSLLSVAAVLQVVGVSLGLYLYIQDNPEGDIAYGAGQITGAILLVVLLGASIRALVKSLRRNSEQTAPTDSLGQS